MFLERRRAGRGAVNLEDDHHSTNKDCKFVLTKKTGNKGLKVLVLKLSWDVHGSLFSSYGFE